MTPLERAARALARRSCSPGGEAQFPYVSADEWEEKNWPDHMPAARAVLEAIREPSEGMREQGAGQLFGSASDDWGDDARLVWQAMIDAALSEG